MSEEGGGKIKNKRQHGQNKPYERRKSWLGKVKDLVTPSWLSGFVKTPKEEDKAYCRPEQDKTLQSLETPVQNRQQNDTRAPPVFVPLDKRNGSPGQIMAPPQSTVIAHATPRSLDPTRQENVPFQAGFTSSQLPLIPEKVSDHHHHMHCSDNDESASDKSDHSKSTSGCSSMIPHPPSTTQKDRVMLELNDTDVGNIKDKLLGSSEKSHSRMNRSATWSAQYNTKRPRKPALVSKPSFDVSLFGSPVAGSVSTIPRDKLNESTFYPGRTTFGGIGSQRRQSLGTTAPYQSSPFPVRQKMKAKTLNNTFSGSVSSSGTARKILETLEKISTPLGDARKIPADDTVMQSLSSSFSFTPSVYRRPTRHSIGGYLNASRELQTPGKGPPLQKVNTPGSASIAANMQRYTPSQKSTSIEATITYQLPGSSQRMSGFSSNAQGGKMKSKKFSQHAPSRKVDDDEDDEVCEIPNLKTDFQLPVKEMPTFNFVTPKPMPQSTRLTSSSQAFTFSSPIQKTPVASADTPTGPPRMEFRFSSPLQQSDGSVSPSKGKTVTFNLGDDNSPLKFNYKASSTAVSTKSPTSQAGLLTKPLSQPSPESSASEGVKVASELKTGSVMDILGKPKETNTKSSSFVNTKVDGFAKFVSKGWTCDVCLVDNKEEVLKCVACSSPKPGVNKAPSPSKNSLASLAGKKGWTCDTCLVSNAEDADKCVACTTAKPGLKKSLSKSSSFSQNADKPAVDWDCGVCLVLNKGESSKCIACESPKPGSQPAATAGGFKISAGAFGGKSGFTLPTTTSSDSNTPKSGFTFGGNSSTGSGFQFKGDSSSTSAGGGFKFGDSSVGLTNKTKSPVKQDLKEEPKTNILSTGNSEQSGSGFTFGASKSPGAACKSKSDSLSGNENKPVGGFVFGKSSSDSQTSTDNVTKLSSDKTVILDSTKLSVTTSTIATTGISFTSKSDTETKTTVSNTTEGFTFGQSKTISGSGQKPTTNGGFVFGQPSGVNTDSGSELKSTSVNSVFGNSISGKTDSGNNNPVFGSDPKTTVNSFSGTNNSGFAFGKKDVTGSEPVMNSLNSTVSPSLKRGRDDGAGPADTKKPFAMSTTPSSSLFQFGTNPISSKPSSTSGAFAFGQTSESKTSGFSSPSFNFGGTSSGGMNATPLTTTSSLFNSSSSTVASGSVFGNTTTVTTASSGATFVFGAASAKPTVATTASGFLGQSSSIFGNSAAAFGGTSTAASTPAFGTPSTNQSFGSGASGANGGFGLSTGFNTAAPFGAPQTSSGPAFGAPLSTAPSAFGSTGTPSFGAGVTSTPAFGAPQTTTTPPAFGSVQSTPSFGAPSTTSTAPGGFNFNSNPSFNFGQQASSTPSNVFQFGGPKQNEPSQQAPVATGGFNFSQSASAPAGTPFSFTATSNQAAAPPTAPPGFGGFNAQPPSTPQNAMFTIGSGSTDNRKIKRAVRKIKR